MMIFMSKTLDEIRAYERARYAANIERERARKRKYAKTKKRKEQVRKWKERNPEFSALWQRQNYRKWRLAAMEALGGLKCNQKGCGVFGDPDVLEIDHVLNDGCHERLTTPSLTLLRRIALSPDKKRYQVLCCNHNRKKQLVQRRKGECK